MDDAPAADDKSVPLFYLQTTDKTSGRTVCINLKCTPEVQAPAVEIDEAKLVSEICDPSPQIEQYKIPLVLGKIYWSEAKSVGSSEQQPGSERHYVTTVQMNDKFAYRKVVPSEIIRHYVISVVLTALEDKFNHPNAKKLYGQFLGHRLDLDQAAYEVRGHGGKSESASVKQSKELVENKVMLLGSQEDSRGAPSKAIDTTSPDADSLPPYDLYYRPKSQVLTVQLSADRLPERIEFNDDRLCVYGTKFTDGKKEPASKLMDVHLPLYIDLSAPVRYKYDDKLCLFRAVFRVLEEPAR